MTTDHLELVAKIVGKELNEKPQVIERMTMGICNEVYKVTLSNKVVIVRMNKDEFELIGSNKHLPLFASLGIKVPLILASDYTKTLFSYAYQIQSFLPGEDIGVVIETLTDDELKEIAKEIVKIFRALEKLPTNGKYGWVGGDESRLVGSWTEIMKVQKIEERNNKTGVVGDELIQKSKELFEEYKGYFDSVPPTYYYDDLSSKNVLIENGKFSGLVDIDTIVYGDPLEAVGGIKASWFGTRHGEVYTKAIEDELDLTKEQRKIVTMYALFSRIWWLSERGIKFNDNTSGEIDEVLVRKDKEIIEGLFAEFKNF